MAAFLYNGERKYSYEVLINTINQHQEYFPLYKAPVEPIRSARYRGEYGE